MSGIKKAAACAGTQTTAYGNKGITIIDHSAEPVNDIETWSPALDYWCVRDDEEEEEDEG